MFLRSGQRLRSVVSPVRFIPPVQVVPGLSSRARGNHPYSGGEVTSFGIQAEAGVHLSVLCSQDQQAQQPTTSVIPTQKRVTEQLTKHWSPFKALRQRYAGTRFEEQRQLHMPQKHKATASDSTMRVEMNNLEEQADNAKARELFWKPLSWLGAI